MHGHPVFKAMHATGCCCRGCLNKWYKVPLHRELNEDQEEKINAEERTSRLEKLDSGFHMPSLLIQPITEKEDKEHLPPAQSEVGKTDSIPFITKKEENIAQSMKDYCLTTVCALLSRVK